MDYTQEMLNRLRAGESVDAIASSFTKDLNEAANTYKAEVDKDNLQKEKLSAADGLLINFKKILSFYEADLKGSELIDALQDITAEDLVDILDETIPLMVKYAALMTQFENEWNKPIQKAPREVENPKVVEKRVSSQDAIDAFLNQFVR